MTQNLSHNELDDIFASNHAFIEFVSTLLVGLGSFALFLTAACYFTDFYFCGLEFLSLFGDLQEGNEVLMSVNLPLTMVVIGVGLRLYSFFGWLVSFLLTSVLCFFFGSLTCILSFSLYKSLLRFEAGGPAVLLFPNIESIITNAGLGLICLLGAVYLCLPSVRQLYRPSPQQTAVDVGDSGSIRDLPLLPKEQEETDIHGLSE